MLLLNPAGKEGGSSSPGTWRRHWRQVL